MVGVMEEFGWEGKSERELGQGGVEGKFWPRRQRKGESLNIF
jgi:hypothetical protein